MARQQAFDIRPACRKGGVERGEVLGEFIGNMLETDLGGAEVLRHGKATPTQFQRGGTQ